MLLLPVGVIAPRDLIASLDAADAAAAGGFAPGCCIIDGDSARSSIGRFVLLAGRPGPLGSALPSRPDIGLPADVVAVLVTGGEKGVSDRMSAELMRDEVSREAGDGEGGPSRVSAVEVSANEGEARCGQVGEEQAVADQGRSLTVPLL